jgi:hypothetical protein
VKKETKQQGPQVTVFDGSALHKKPSLEDKASKKQFLVTNTYNIPSSPF